MSSRASDRTISANGEPKLILKNPSDWKEFEAQFIAKAKSLNIWDQIDYNNKKIAFKMYPDLDDEVGTVDEDFLEIPGNDGPHEVQGLNHELRLFDQAWTKYRKKLEAFKAEHYAILELKQWLCLTVEPTYMRILYKDYRGMCDLFFRLKVMATGGREDGYGHKMECKICGTNLEDQKRGQGDQKNQKEDQ